MANKKNLQAQRRWLINQREKITKPWRFAIFELREQLAQECLTRRAENRRFQNRRLIENFIAKIDAVPEASSSSVMSYWLFCGSPWQAKFGYEAARKQHRAELRALGFSPEFHPKGSRERIANELVFRVDSLASWLEAEESWIVWRTLNRQPAMWDRTDPIARRRATGASIISRMPTITDGISDWGIARLIEGLGGWSSSQWVKILKTAAHLAERPERAPTELEMWVWWRFPIFSRYRWSVAEVVRAGRQRFGEIHRLDNEAAFQSAWVRRGLRFTGRKRRRKLPPLWEFVVNEAVPTNIPSTYSPLAWIPYEKSRPRS